MMETLYTPRTVLRSWRMSDSKDMFEYAKDPDVGPMAGWKPHDNEQESESIISHFISDGEVWAIELRETGRVIGSVGLHKKQNGVSDRELGYVLAKPYWGQGIMVEVCTQILDFAFKKLGLSSVCVAHFPFNTQSRRVIEKLGFTHLDRLSHAYERFDGAVLDEERYIMTKEDFSEHKTV